MDNIVISEMPDSHVVYQYTEACLDTWLESGDMNFLVDYIEDTYLTEASKMNYVDDKGNTFKDLWDDYSTDPSLFAAERKEKKEL